MRIVIDIDTLNDAFQDDTITEIRRILSTTIDSYKFDNLLCDDETINLRDYNGNKVGKMYIE